VGLGAALRVVIADADTRFADRLEAELREAAGLTCVGRASSEAELVELVDSISPDLAFVDRDTSWAEPAARRILDRDAPPRLFLLSAEPEPVPAPGVSGYIAKNEDAAEVAGFVAALCPLTSRAVDPSDVDDDPAWAQAGALDAS
jgi:AmiR/NasT family two-component response regulator